MLFCPAMLNYPLSYNKFSLRLAKMLENHGFLAKITRNIRAFSIPVYEAANALCVADPDHDRPK